MSDLPASPITPTIDLDAPGASHGFLRLPHSRDDSAWGSVMIPIAVLRGGDGPTALLTGGNHGDEYEGPITIARLIRELDPGEIRGRVILLPSLNAPAALAGRRTSPVDGKNFNRCFPGNPGGTATEQIAFYVHDVLFPLADAFMDLHSGGSSLEILPSAIIEPASDSEQMRRIVAAVGAFDAPYTVLIDNLGDPRTSTASAVRAGLTVVGTELFSIPFFLLLALSQNLGWALVAFWMRAALMNMNHPVSTAFSMSTVPREEQAVTNSVRELCWNIAWMASTHFGGALIQARGYAPPMFITMGLYAIAAALFYRFFHDRPGTGRSPLAPEPVEPEPGL